MQILHVTKNREKSEMNFRRETHRYHRVHLKQVRRILFISTREINRGF